MSVGVDDIKLLQKLDPEKEEEEEEEDELETLPQAGQRRRQAADGDERG